MLFSGCQVEEFCQCNVVVCLLATPRPHDAAHAEPPPRLSCHGQQKIVERSTSAGSMPLPGRDAPRAASSPRIRLCNLSAPSHATVTADARVNKSKRPSYAPINTDPTDRSGIATRSDGIGIKNDCLGRPTEKQGRVRLGDCGVGTPTRTSRCPAIVRDQPRLGRSTRLVRVRGVARRAGRTEEGSSAIMPQRRHSKRRAGG